MSTAEEAISKQCSPAIQNLTALADHTSVNTGYKVNCSNATVYTGLLSSSYSTKVMPRVIVYIHKEQPPNSECRPLPIIYIPDSVVHHYNIISHMHTTFTLNPYSVGVMYTYRHTGQHNMQSIYIYTTSDHGK